MGRSSKIRGHILTVAIFAVVAVAVLFVLFNLSGAVSLGETHRVKAIVPQAGSLTQGTSVTMAGARIGTVTGVVRHGVGALVDIRIDEADVWPMSVDSTAKLSVRTPLGENYVELQAGRSKEHIDEGGTIAPAKGDEYVDIDQILSILQGNTRDRARQLIQGLGTTVRGRGGELNDTLRGAAGILQSGSSITAQLADDHKRIGQLVAQLGDVAQAVGERGESIRALAREGVTAFGAIADRDERVRELIGEMPATLRQVRSTSGTLRELSLSSTPVVANLATAVREVRPAVRRLPAAAREGQGVVRALDRAADPLTATLGALRSASPTLTPMLPAIRKVLCETNPALRYLEPYVKDVMNFATDLGAASNSYDAVGHTIRLMPIFGENSMFAAPDSVSKAAFALTRSGFMQKIAGLDFEPFPKPGEANTSYDGSTKGKIGPKDVADSGSKYERVTADC